MSGDLPEELMDVETDLFGDDESGEVEEGEEVEYERITVFDLGGELYGTPVLEVREVVETTGITRVPRTAEAIDGITDLRGEIAAVINPWVHLSLPEEPGDWEDQLVVVFTGDGDEQTIGIRIDRIVGVEPFHPDQVTWAEDDDELEGSNAGNPLVGGIARREADGEVTDRIGLIDTRALVDVSSQHPFLTGDVGANPTPDD
jgi:purine-binding chemotaxis protein CheW